MASLLKLFPWKLIISRYNIYQAIDEPTALFKQLHEVDSC